LNGHPTLNGSPFFKGIELDEKIKQAVVKWRQEDYNGVSEVTKRLLNYWFVEDHFDERSGRQLSFWENQKEAIEALIYVYEVMKYDTLLKLSKGFNVSLPLSLDDPWSKYGFKMATGSGKTIVMELAIVWQYFNKIFNTDNGVRYTNRFLVIAPNLIVLDRLYQGSFESLKEIKNLPFIPPEWKDYFDVQLVLQSEKVPRHSRGIIYLTNIQQLYEREQQPLNPVDEILGSKPKSEDDPIAGWEYLWTSLTQEEDLMVINDEAHHIYYDSPSEWYNSVKGIDEILRSKFGKGITCQLDFSATPKDSKGNLLPHIIYDYPLKKAIRDGIVKYPIIGIVSGVPKPPTQDYVTRSKVQIDIGLKLLNEYKEKLKPTKKKPVMFVMCDINKHADQIADYIKSEKGLNEKVLVIHTDTTGEITKKDLPKLRQDAREIDTNQYEVIVSVMMLKEGWDVRNVVVIVPLRAFDSPVLPEQTLGRGLRKMEPFMRDNKERLTVVDHPKFKQLWDAEVKYGDLDAEIKDIKDVKPELHVVMPDPKKLKYDLEIPLLEGSLIKWVPQISKLDVTSLRSKVFNIDEIEVPKVLYKEKELLTQKIIREEEIAFDYTDNYDLYLSFMVSGILRRNRLPRLHFPELLPKVDEYIKEYLFNKPIDTSNKDVVLKLNHPFVREYMASEFSNAFKELYQQIEPPTYIAGKYKVSDTQVMHTSKSEDHLYAPKKSIFNLIPADSIFEVDFMKYLDAQEDVEAYTKVLRNMMPLHILYYDMQNYARYYIPDFIIKSRCGYYIVETKGKELDQMQDVRYKDKAANAWCKRITELTKDTWKYVKILSEDFYSNRSLSFCELVKYIGYQAALDDK
jgi:type III restriction enzyme